MSEVPLLSDTNPSGLAQSFGGPAETKYRDEFERPQATADFQARASLSRARSHSRWLSLSRALSPSLTLARALSLSLALGHHRRAPGPNPPTGVPRS